VKDARASIFYDPAAWCSTLIIYRCVKIPRTTSSPSSRRILLSLKRLKTYARSWEFQNNAQKAFAK
jgi:hypothetical protein